MIEDEIELKPGRFVRVDPGSTRVPVAGDDGLEFVTSARRSMVGTSRPISESAPCTQSN